METADTCQCGLTYQEWMDYDIQQCAPNDDLHIWEQE